MHLRRRIFRLIRKGFKVPEGALMSKPVLFFRWVLFPLECLHWKWNQYVFPRVDFNTGDILLTKDIRMTREFLDNLDVDLFRAHWMRDPSDGTVYAVIPPKEKR